MLVLVLVLSLVLVLVLVLVMVLVVVMVLVLVLDCEHEILDKAILVGELISVAIFHGDENVVLSFGECGLGLVLKINAVSCR